MIDRTNDDWLDHLARTGPAKDGAVGDLRDVLRRGLGKALHGHPRADDAFLDDITQDAVLHLLDGLTTFRGGSKFTTWAIAVALRVAFSELRRARWRDVSLDGLADVGQAVEAVDREAPSSQLERDELIAVMRRVMETGLSERQRFTLMGLMQGVPQAELCARLDLAPNAFYKLGHDARKKLKQGLIAAGVTEDDVRDVFAITS